MYWERGKEGALGGRGVQGEGNEIGREGRRVHCERGKEGTWEGAMRMREKGEMRVKREGKRGYTRRKERHWE